MKNKEAGMTLIVKTITRLTVGLILIYGIYIVLRGHISPGGGFAGGVIIALSFIHLILAYGKDKVINKISESRGILFASLGALLYLAVANAGLRGIRISGHQADYKVFGAGVIPLLDIAAAILVGAGLFVIFLALALLVSRKEGK